MNNTFRIGFPLEYARKRGLEEGDIFVWVEDDDGNVRGKIVKQRKLAEIAIGILPAA
jgi:hypothetical protein